MQQLSVNSTIKVLDVSDSIRTDMFDVFPGSLVKIRVAAIDALNMVNNQALVCKLTFFDADGYLVEGQYTGASLSRKYGNFIYIESVTSAENVFWCKDLITVPDSSVKIKLEFFLWKCSANLTILGDPTCVDARYIENSDEEQWPLARRSSCEKKYGILPFWKSRFAFEILVKAGDESKLTGILLGFQDEGGHEIDIDSSQCTLRVGSVKKTGDFFWELKPLVARSSYDGFDKLHIFLNIVPPLKATSLIVKYSNQDDKNSVLVSSWFNAYDAIVESRLPSGLGELIVSRGNLPYHLAKLSLAKLREQRPDDVRLLESELAFYSAHGDLTLIEKTANAILNSNLSGAIRYKARHALSEIAELNTDWVPKSGAVQSVTDNPVSSVELMKIAYLCPSIESASDISTGPIGPGSIDFSEFVADFEPLVVTALGGVHAGVSGEPWEKRQHESFFSYHINCMTAEQWKTIPVTQQLNFQALLMNHILGMERVNLIHVYDGDRGYDLALIALALSKAHDIPFVYERNHHHYSLDEAGYVSSLTRARENQEFRCMCDADAVIVKSGQYAFWLAQHGIDTKKIFLLPDKDSASYSDEIVNVYGDAYRYAYRNIGLNASQ